MENLRPVWFTQQDTVSNEQKQTNKQNVFCIDWCGFREQRKKDEFMDSFFQYSSFTLTSKTVQEIKTGTNYMKLNQLEIKTFTNMVNYKLCYVKLTKE